VGVTEVSGVEKWIRAWRHIGLLASAGWDAAIRDVDLVLDPGAKAHLYVVDLVTSWVWMGAVAPEGFREVSEAGKKANAADREQIRGALGVLVARLSDGREPRTPDHEEQLGLLASLYAGGTKIYAAEKGFPDGCHFVVLVYRKPGSDTVMLRPFAIGQSPDKPVSPDVLENMVASVVRIDRIRHPEWLEGKASKDE
jgi:hypothetical protein